MMVWMMAKVWLMIVSVCRTWVGERCLRGAGGGDGSGGSGGVDDSGGSGVFRSGGGGLFRRG